mmetsp:Transcript_8443/g.28012  ORF Transcript_8443/g.28012 Transcript_8443/m.28012 type:complete len:235 (+) Transcript_8443:1143-1847(+)
MQVERPRRVVRHVPELEVSVGRDDGELAEVLDDVRAVVRPGALDGDGELCPAPPLHVALLLGRQHHWLVLVDVDVEHVRRHIALPAERAPDGDREVGAHLAPDERHLGAEPKLAARLLDSVVGPRQDAPQHVRNVLVRHSSPVILDDDAVEGARACLAPAALRLARRRLALRRALRVARLFLQPLLALLLRLVVVVQLLIHAVVLPNPNQVVQPLEHNLLDGDVDGGELVDRLG